MSTPKNPHALKQFVIALTIVLIGVSFGSMLALKKADQDIVRQGRPARGLGHDYPTSQNAITEAAKNTTNADTPLASNDYSWTNSMVWIPGGKFLMGSTNGQGDEVPAHEVELDGFWMDKYEVTNEDYARFADATGHVTLAERKPNPQDFPGVPPENLVPGSIVFNPPQEDVPLNNHYIWWKYEPGASWRSPTGGDSSYKSIMDHPVVHVAWLDAMAYAKWATKRLPTEAEWEYAARGGSKNLEYTWGTEKKPGGKWLGNIFQGKFPNNNTLVDGFKGTAPVGKFPPNEFGLFDMAGNVWEWCNDWYMPDYYSRSPKKNPQGPDNSYDPNEPGVWKKVNRGGSFLCNDSYCAGYRPSMRMKTSADTGLGHTGFRCVRSGPSPEEIAKILAAKSVN